MADIDDGLDEAFKGFGEEPAAPPVVPPVVDPAAPVVPPVTPAEPPKPVEEPKKDEAPADPSKPKEGETPAPPADPTNKPEEGGTPPQAPETPPAPQEPAAPLTKDDIKSVVSDLLTGERASGKELETATNDVLSSYYPEGLSNTLIDQKTGKELKLPQDVIDASGGEMSMEQASQWLMNEQYKLDQNVANIRKDAERVAETTITFKRDAVAAVEKYQPLFKAYPQLQQKAFDLMMKQVKDDRQKNVILEAPDVMDLYDTYLEPYQKAYEFSTKQSATNPAVPPAVAPPAVPGAEDRLDEGGDGGQSPVNDPNDFGQQVAKELAKGL